MCDVHVRRHSLVRACFFSMNILVFPGLACGDAALDAHRAKSEREKVP